MAEKRNIHQRLLESKRTLLGVKWEKDLGNAQFRSVSIDTMKQHVERAQVEAGIVAVGPDVTVEVTDVPRGTGQSPMRQWYVEGTMSYVNVDDPTDTVAYHSYGEAADVGDKGLNKALTGFWKNHYKVLYNIAERDDDVDSYAEVPGTAATPARAEIPRDNGVPAWAEGVPEEQWVKPPKRAGKPGVRAAKADAFFTRGDKA